MTSPWTFSGNPVSTDNPAGSVALIESSTFCISDRAGDVGDGRADGLFFRDTRIVSRLKIRLNGASLEPLALRSIEPFAATFVGRGTPPQGRADSPLLVFRSRYVGQGIREDVTIRNYNTEASYCKVEVEVGTDFADLFAVKEGRAKGPDAAARIEARIQEGAIEYRYKKGSIRKGVRFKADKEARIEEDLISYEVVIPPKGSFSFCLEISPILDSTTITPRYRCGEEVVSAAPTQRMESWRRAVPLLESDHEWLPRVIEQSLEDLGALRIFDPDDPDSAVVAAGAPWFMTVFGRDSIITSYMALLADPTLALGALKILARFQGTKVDPLTDEQPGRILHEMRFAEAASMSLGEASIYYGSIDATPLFVVLLGELRRWGLAPDLVDELLPAADRALQWIEEYGDLDGDGYVEYKRLSDRGLANQGWKDSFDAIRYGDGSIAHAPIALAEVQGYVYSAYLARAHFAEERGDFKTRARYARKAVELKERFNRDFWMEEKGFFAVGLDPEKKPIDSVTSNIGHCLWTGIVDKDKAEQVARALMSKEMFSGWGIRTLSSENPGYNPISYHCGSVWPHDNALIAAGLARYGFYEEAAQVAEAILQAAANMGGRLPELFSGISRQEFPVVVRYPTSCSPQAWAAAAPIMLIRVMLQLNPWIPHKKVWINPHLPPSIKYLKVERIPLAGSHVSVEVEGSDFEVKGLPEDIEVIRAPRDPHTALI